MHLAENNVSSSYPDIYASRRLILAHYCHAVLESTRMEEAVVMCEKKGNVLGMSFIDSTHEMALSSELQLGYYRSTKTW